MTNTNPRLSAALAALLLAACSPGDDNTTVRPLPNSLADTSTHRARPEIPAYGPPAGNVDSIRTAQVRGQVLYVPVYSHIFQRSEEREFDLTATLSFRNTSPSTELRIHAVDYFDSGGTLLKSYLRQPRFLAPLASTYVVIEEADRSGGVGANFIVVWQAERPVSPPLVEAVMISTAYSQGVSFTSAARTLQEW